MSAFLAIISRDLRLAARAGGDALTLVLFFVMVGAVVPFAIGPDRVLLAKLAPGIIWIAAFLSMLLGLDRLFRADDEDGSLLLFRHAGPPLEAVVVAKLVAHWLLTALPVLIASPLLAILLAMDAGDAIGGHSTQAAVGYYAQLWALILFMESRPEYRDGLSRLMRDAQAGQLRQALGMQENNWTALKLSGRAYNSMLGEPLFKHYITQDLDKFEREYRQFCQTLARL